MKEKIPFYDIVNMFFVGAVFCLGSCILLYEYIPLEWIKENSELLSSWSVFLFSILLIAMFEIGFIINRMGSVIIAPLYEGKIWPKDEYSIDVSELAQSNARFQSLITELILMRSQIMMCVILFLVSLVQHMWVWGTIYIGLIIIFTLSGQKHNDKINRMRHDYVKRKQDEPPKQ